MGSGSCLEMHVWDRLKKSWEPHYPVHCWPLAVLLTARCASALKGDGVPTSWPECGCKLLPPALFVSGILFYGQYTPVLPVRVFPCPWTHSAANGGRRQHNGGSFFPHNKMINNNSGMPGIWLYQEKIEFDYYLDVPLKKRWKISSLVNGLQT